MKSLTAAGAAVLALGAVGAATASGANWDPPNSNQHGSGTLVLTTNVGTSVTCTFTSAVRSTGNDVATTVNSAGAAAPPTFTGCTNSLGISGTTVDSPAAWTATATTTTAVDVTGGAVITLGGGICRITAHASVGGNTWSNSTHSLTANSSVNFPLTESGFCDGATSGHMSGTIGFPAAVIIT